MDTKHTINIEQVDTTNRKVVKVYASKMLLHDNHLEWLESVDVEKEVPIDSELEDDTELKIIPEFSHCLVSKKDFIGVELQWDQEELMFQLTVVASNFRFSVHNESREKLSIIFNELKFWLFEK